MTLPKIILKIFLSANTENISNFLPHIKNENTKVITMLIFTLVALSFLGLFAINPTLATIIELHKQLDESTFVHQSLTTKMSNLSNLQQQYTSLSNDLPFVYDALPQTAKVPTVVGQIERLAQQSNLKITSLTVSPVILSDPKQPEGVKTHASFTFSLEAEGAYQDMLTFATELTNFDRIVTIESLSFLKDAQTDTLILGVKGREYFKK